MHKKMCFSPLFFCDFALRCKKVISYGGIQMISNQILQSTIEGLADITNIDMCVMDIDGKYLASTTDKVEELSKSACDFVKLADEEQSLKGYVLFKIYDEYQAEYILAVYGDTDEAKKVGKIAVFQIQSLLVAYRERFDSDNFFKSLLLDNLLLVDIYNRAKKLHIDTEAKRVIFIVEMPEGQESTLLEKARTILGNKGKDFVTAVDEKSAIVIHEVSGQVTYQAIESYAKSMIASLEATGVQGFRVAYGTIVSDIKEVSKSYKEARLALDVGRIFFTGKNVIAYNTLGIGRLIYQLPIPLCKMFIREIFEGKSPDDFDEETLLTIDKFFENSLNVSETSRQLFIHRNTLVYRLDKIQKITGLDLRVFEDAITFRIAMMVVKYMNYMETLEY